LNCQLVIKNVPSFVCTQCGEISYDGEVAQRLEQIVNNINGTSRTEIAVVSYSEKAANFSISLLYKNQSSRREYTEGRNLTTEDTEFHGGDRCCIIPIL